MDVRPGVYDSDNVTGADNQQERLDGYIAGYVDGEGSFSVSVQRNSTCRVGFQLIPEFHVSQNGDRAQVLEMIRDRLGCGYIKPNSKRDRALVLVVRERQARRARHSFLRTRPDPFSEASGLWQVRPRREKHGSRSTSESRRLRRVARPGAVDERRRQVQASQMERASSRPESSVTVRRTGLKRPEDTVRAAWRHAESGRNVLTLERGTLGSNKTVGPYPPWALEA